VLEPAEVSVIMGQGAERHENPVLSITESD